MLPTVYSKSLLFAFQNIENNTFNYYSNNTYSTIAVVCHDHVCVESTSDDDVVEHIPQTFKRSVVL